MRKFLTHRLLMSATALGVLLVLAPQAQAASSPSWLVRPDYITFNALSDNPAYGDEHDFLRVRSIANNNFANVLKVNGPQELVLQLFYINDSARASLVSKNTQAKISLAVAPANDVTIKAFISSDNAQPKIVDDVVRVISDSPIKLTYEAGSAQVWSNVFRGKSVSDNLMASGTKVGFAQLNGNLPGGPHYSGYLTVKIRVAVIQSSSNLKAPSTPAAGNITNTGPGDIMGVFAVSSIAGTAYHLLRTSRRQAR